MSSGAGDASRREKYDLRVEEVDGEAIVTARVPRSADACYRLFSSVDRLHEWLAVASDIRVVRRDDRDRATAVEFRGSLQDASIVYCLDYEYDDARRRVQWSSALESGTIVKIAGSVRFVPIGRSSCWLRYRLISQRAHFLPRWEDEQYEEQPAVTVVLDFCDWVSRA